MGDLQTEVERNIRSCLISTKGSITLKQLEDDYRLILGERIPFQKLGHKSLESLLQSIPTIYVRRSSTNEILVDAKISAQTAHISAMVGRQKTEPKKPSPRRHHVPKRRGNPPPVTPKWRPKKKTLDKKRYENSPKLAAVSHNQFVSGGGYQPKNNINERKEKLVLPPPTSDKSVYSNCMKRVTRLMAEMQPERDSGNSSPTLDFVNNYKVQEFVKTSDPIVDIRNFALYHKLGDVDVKFTETQTKKKKTQFHCKITVGQHKYSSYPEDFFEQLSAERHASQKALDDLMLKYSKRRTLLLSSLEDILDRIPPMLEKHNCALWMWQIEADYIDKYNEQLPSDWLQIIDNSPYVSIEKCLGGYVLKHCNPDDKNEKITDSTLMSIDDVSVPCNSIHFGEHGRVYAIATAIHSTNEIWFQEVETPAYEKFTQTMEKVDAFYRDRDDLLAKTIHTGSCYIARNDSNWYRVRAVGIPEKNLIHCFSIDYGDEFYITKDKLYIMNREFALEQAQAFVCKLAGLEDFVDISTESDVIQTLIGQEVILELVVEESASDDSDVTIPVVMYDVTSSESLNEWLIRQLTIENAKPTLDPVGITECYVTHIEPNADVYIQIRNFGYHRLAEQLSELNESLFGIKPKAPTKHKDRLYLIQTDDGYRRVSVIDWSPISPELAQIYFVDYGNTRVVNVTHQDFFRLEHIDRTLCQYPGQAVKVRFMTDKILGDFVKKAEKLLEKEIPVLVKISSRDNEGIPWVEFYKRTKDGVLVFINKCLTVEDELQSAPIVAESTRKRLINFAQLGSDSLKPVPSGGSLPKPHLPKVGAYFNVIIPFSVNPWNFFVQPLESYGVLQGLMAQMQEYYKDVDVSPMPIEDIVPGKIYASKHEDGLWYRTSVLKVIHSGSISVYYCDFGYYTNLTVAQLVFLDDKFVDFPYQALKAKIAGIKPIMNKWTMEDCDMFNTLVMKKEFVSILISIEKDELYKSDLVLQLLLIDTTGNEDVHIKQVLIERGIATAV